MRTPLHRCGSLLASAVALAALAATPAAATFPGRNGEIAVAQPSLGPSLALYAPKKGDLLGTFGPTSGRAGELGWSPDGSMLALVNYGSVASYVTVARFPSGDPVARIPLPTLGIAVGPTFAADGRRLAFAFFDYDGDAVDISGIYLATLDGAAPQRLTASGAQRISWSPDGSTIIFSNLAGISAIGAGGAGERVILPNVAGSAPGIAGLDWAPDGRMFTYGATVAGNADVFVASADGSLSTRVTSNAAPDSSPAWAPDGKSIVFVSARDGAPAHDELYTVRLGQPERRLTSGAPDQFGYPSLLGPAWRPLPR